MFAAVLGAVALLGGAVAQGEAAPASIGAGDPDGRYHEFVVRLAEQLDGGPPVIVETAGSRENLQGLKSGAFQFAVVQSDIAHHQYFGNFEFERWRGFTAIAPLFPEYVQIVVRDEPAAPTSLGALRQRVVGIGLPGSGSALNARELLEEAGLVPGISLMVQAGSIEDNLSALNGGQIDAMIVTSASDFRERGQRMRLLAPPERLIRELSASRPYYETAFMTSSHGEYETIAVRGLLLAGSDADRETVEAISQALISEWAALSRIFPGLWPPKGFISESEPFPVHPRTRALLIASGHADPRPNYVAWGGAAWVLLFAFSLIAFYAQSNYSRTGGRFERRGRWAGLQTAIDLWAPVGSWFVGLSVFAALLLGFLVCLRWVEAEHARNFNLDSPFLELTLREGFMWMLTYVSSGFTENDAFPATVAGRFIVAALALVGVTGPIWAIIWGVRYWARRNARVEAGLAPNALSWRNHILVCGWNEKLDGLVYAITSDDAENKRRVCIIAESGEATPFTGNRFDKSRVRFVRGDSAEKDVLSLANAEGAQHAIILADYARRESENLGAVLTAMNLRRLNPEIGVSAELAFSQNADHFASFGCRTLITPDVIVAKAAALSTIHPRLIDFLFEVLTYDVFDEIYGIAVQDLAAQDPLISVDMSVAELESLLMARGLNLIGLVEARDDREAAYEAEISAEGPVRPLVDPGDMDRRLAASDTVIYSASQRSLITRARRGAASEPADPVTPAQLSFKRPRGKRFLLYGSTAHLDRLQANLQAFHLDPVIHRIAIEDSPFLTRERLERCLPDDAAFDHAIVMASAQARHSAATADAIRAIDAGTLLTSKLIREHARRAKWSCRITAEVLSANDRDAFSAGEADDDAIADTIVPSSTLVERFLVKEAADGNAVHDYLVAIMNMRDGTHLFAHDVAPGDPLIGQTYAGLLGYRVRGLRLLGWLPKTMQEVLRNRTGDFDYHFRTSINDRIRQTEVQEGDLLIFAACFELFEAGDGRSARASE